ncbi:ParB/RepB/Spo0J family partition protein [Qipengyuania sp. 1XM1-15A]|uniref:ParB/RepB/Spo0J family partition protein n=1 Tax=Qipengyuania xiamenensis TaxID=2867237 RepID=UPI001C8696F2|nr:ParB/RepB/Spo0J family partition protein [Qipengyuania xiamenensis]MBX7533956.1 ParB/RepB/Spo0J family partition protein [Qipengyuania xiamenensis]
MSTAIDRKKKLGRGLGALMGEIQREEPLVREENAPAQGAETATVASANGLSDIPVADISPLPGQPRTHFDEEALDQLAASIAQRGVIQPVIVTPAGKGRYRLVAGERRWRAAQRARLHAIPAIVRDLDEREVMALALIENLQREDLNPVEEARAYQKLSDDEGMTQAEIAKLVDKSRSHVANFQRLLALPDDVLALVADSKLTMGHAKALVGHDDASEIARRAAKENLSVREVEKLARGDRPKKATSGSPKPIADSSTDADIAAVQGHLEEFLGLPVKIKTEGAPGTGTVTIGYRTLDQLDLICQRLTGGEI